ncbi:MAG: MoxR family ATPase [Treponema sp.]|nr:MoxR family ATPase [Treponema sp.]
MSDENQKEIKETIDTIKSELARRIVGQKTVVEGILTAVACGGHILLEGVPGLAKTLAVKTFAEISGLSFKRIQFTPDLLPADVSGTLIYEQGTGRFSVRKGPVFTNVVLADEINRSPAKVQSALLEAMAEKQVTIGSESYALPEPFLVLATQNPIEQEGTYNLPEAELDRFLLKILVDYPSPREEVAIVKSCGNAHMFPVSRILDAGKIKEIQCAADSVKCADKIIEYIVSIVNATRPSALSDKKSGGKFDSFSKNSGFLKYINFGSSPRAGIAMLKCAKAHALFDGRDFVLPEDVKAVAAPVLRHRIVLSYEANADGITSDELIERILNFVPIP